MKKGIGIVNLILLTMISYSQQDPQYSQYMFNLAAVNPGYTGSHDMICISGVNRQQWVGFDGAPSYSFFNANAAIKPFGFSSGVGLSLFAIHRSRTLRS